MGNPALRSAPNRLNLQEFAVNADLYAALHRLVLESIHFRDARVGSQFLTSAIEQAQDALTLAEAVGIGGEYGKRVD